MTENACTDAYSHFFLNIDPPVSQKSSVLRPWWSVGDRAHFGCSLPKVGPLRVPVVVAEIHGTVRDVDDPCDGNSVWEV